MALEMTSFSPLPSCLFKLFSFALLRVSAHPNTHNTKCWIVLTQNEVRVMCNIVYIAVFMQDFWSWKCEIGKLLCRVRVCGRGDGVSITVQLGDKKGTWPPVKSMEWFQIGLVRGGFYIEKKKKYKVQIGSLFVAQELRSKYHKLTE